MQEVRQVEDRFQDVNLPVCRVGHRDGKQASMPKANGKDCCVLKGCAQQHFTDLDLLRISSWINAREDDETVNAQCFFGSKFAAMVFRLQRHFGRRRNQVRCSKPHCGKPCVLGSSRVVPGALPTLTPEQLQEHAVWGGLVLLMSGGS